MPRGEKREQSGDWFVVCRNWQPEVGPDVLAAAMRYTMGYDQKLSKKFALYLLDMLKEDGTVLDNEVDAEIRGIFYDLREKGLFGTERHDLTLYKGKGWRVHQWHPVIPKVLEAAKLADEPPKQKVDYVEIYGNEEIWVRNNQQANGAVD